MKNWTGPLVFGRAVFAAGWLIHVNVGTCLILGVGTAVSVYRVRRHRRLKAICLHRIDIPSPAQAVVRLDQPSEPVRHRSGQWFTRRRAPE